MNVHQAEVHKLGNWEKKEIARAERLMTKALFPGETGKGFSLQHKIKDDSTAIMWWRGRDGVLVRNVFRGQTARTQYEVHHLDKDFGFEITTGWTLEQIAQKMDELRRRG